ncbi:MAG: MurR/RpiR family transcriptional regulator [Pseudomonadota bacterium]
MPLSERIDERLGTLTAGERKAATALKADYPFTGLLTVAEFAKRANVSSQTILRLASKLGFQGYSQFQQTLIGELKEGYQSPVTLREKRGDGKGAGSFFAGLVESAVRAAEETASFISDAQLEIIVALLSDQKRGVHLLGGRITDTLASYLARHMKQIRPKVYKVPTDHEEWPDYLLRLGRNDVVFMVDVRRYQADLDWFAEQAAASGAHIILLTDRWISPISRHSTHVLPVIIDVGTPWDTSVTALLLIEALINKVAEADWPKTRSRIERWDSVRFSPGVATLDGPTRWEKGNAGDE